MGVYLSAPITEKKSSNGENDYWSYGATSMQGWRVNQEDAHNCILNFDEGCAFFAVYDGHGGSEVAEYSCEKFPDFLKSLEVWKSGKLGQALEDAFLSFDRNLVKPEVLKALKKRADSNSAAKKNEESLEIDDAEKHMLLEECHLPLDQLLQKFVCNDDLAWHLLNRKFNSGVDKNVLKRQETAAFECIVNKRVSTFPPCEEEREAVVEQEEMVEETETETTVVVSSKGGGTKRMRDSPPDDCGVAVVQNHVNKTCFSSDSPQKSSSCSSEQNGPLAIKRVKIEGEQNDKNNSELQSVGHEKLLSDIPGVATTTSAATPDAADCLSGDGDVHHDDKTNRISAAPDSVGEVCACATATTISPEVDEHRTEATSSPRCNGEENETMAAPASESSRNNQAVDTNKASEDSDVQLSDEIGSEEKSATASESERTSSSLEEDELVDEDESENQEDYVDQEDEEEADSEEDDSDYEFPTPTGDTPGIDSGTTACMLILKDSVAYCANAGDSRCVLCRDGIAVQMSVDHKPEDENERQRIVNAGGKVTVDGRVNGGLNLSRALGDHFYKHNPDIPLKDQMISPLPDVFVQTLDGREQFFVLACDGIWNAMENQEVVDFIKLRMSKGASPREICEQLCDACLSQSTEGDGTGCDNMTVVIVMAKDRAKNSNAAV